MLLYPLLGILADTCFNRYRLIKVSIILLFLNSFVLLIFFIVLLGSHGSVSLLGSTVVSPYVGMAAENKMSGYNASISVQTLIFHLVVNSTRLKTVRSALWHCPNSTVALRLLENVVKVTNLEVVKIEFRHLPCAHLLLLSSIRLPSSLTRGDRDTAPINL